MKQWRTGVSPVRPEVYSLLQHHINSPRTPSSKLHFVFASGKPKFIAHMCGGGNSDHICRGGTPVPLRGGNSDLPWNGAAFSRTVWVRGTRGFQPLCMSKTVGSRRRSGFSSSNSHSSSRSEPAHTSRLDATRVLSIAKTLARNVQLSWV
jgi:hypothetical protein